MQNHANPSLYEELLEQARDRGSVRPPRSSASVVPWRRRDELEVFWVRRSPKLRFMGGWHAFPGGGLAQTDAGVPIEGDPQGTSPEGFSAPVPEIRPGEALATDLIPGLVACAVRELFEETGLLLADDGWTGSGALSAADRERLLAARRRLLDGAELGDLVSEGGWKLTAASLVFAGRWMTPPLAPLRFDNRFFLLEWPAERAVQPEILRGELVAGEWITPAGALDRWRRGEVLTAPPILHFLRVLAEDGPERGLGRLRCPVETHLGPMRRVEFRPGVVLLPLRTPTLPPATHTNAYLLGRDEVVLIDPASPFPEEIDRLGRAMAAVRERGQSLKAIWLTHHHPDHVGGVEAMRRQLDVPVLAHPHTADVLSRRGLRVDGGLRDGQRFELRGDPPFPVRVLHTPGHTQGHLCFFDEIYRSLIAGDLLSGLSTIVIDPPEGDMDAYLRSVERIIEWRPATLFPAHGPVLLPAVDQLQRLRDHRLWREERVFEAWNEGRRTPSDMVAQVYDDVPPDFHPLAERQILAHLDRLKLTGRISP